MVIIINATDIDLKELRRPLEEALMVYEKLHNEQIQFQDFPDLALTPDKPNSARTIIPVKCLGSDAGIMYAVVFAAGDGTGDTSTYKIGELTTINPKLDYTEKPERVLPRAKTGIICEGFFPLFSLNKNKQIIKFAASLEELTVMGEANSILMPVWKLGLDQKEYIQAINSGRYIPPKVQVTVGTNKEGMRVGDPHAIHYGTNCDGALQVVGFLAVKDENNPLLKLNYQWDFPKRLC